MLMKLPGLCIKSFCLSNCIVQGGMGAGVSLHPLAGAVSKKGGLGTIASVGLRTIVSLREKKDFDTYKSVRIEIEKAKEASAGKPVAINVMCAVVGDYENTIKAAIDAKVDAIVSGAGLPLGLPSIQSPRNTALIPIVSSARALEIIIKRWERLYYRPDAVVLEGPLAGGHLGFKMSEIENPEFALEKLLEPVLEVAHKHGDFPVIVAGGIYSHEDILEYLALGASGVQIGTRFLATNESTATEMYKNAVVSAEKCDIEVVAYPEKVPASPCGLPFRVLRTSPMYKALRQPKCNRRYLLLPGADGKLSFCQAMPANPNSKSFLCLCNGLLSSAGYILDEPALFTVGTNAFRVNKILSVAELMRELRGE